jgi:hypothetical protein
MYDIYNDNNSDILKKIDKYNKKIDKLILRSQNYIDKCKNKNKKINEHKIINYYNKINYYIFKLDYLI